MGTIKNLATACKKMPIRQTVERAVLGTSLFLINYNKQQLFEDSLGADGQRLNLYRSIPYALWKNKRNKAPGFMHPDLYDTGAFYKGFFAEVKDFSFEIDSKDKKSNTLKNKYGDTIFGLTEASKAEYTRKEFFNTLKRIIESRTGLKFS